MHEEQFEIRYSKWFKPSLGILGLGPKFSRVTLSDATLDVTMGWAFRMSAPRSAITTVRHDVGPDSARVMGWGVHGWRGSWLVNGSSDGIVDLAFEPAATARVMGLPMAVRKLRVSLVEPDAFVDQFSG